MSSFQKEIGATKEPPDVIIQRKPLIKAPQFTGSSPVHPTILTPGLPGGFEFPAAKSEGKFAVSRIKNRIVVICRVLMATF